MRIITVFLGLTACSASSDDGRCVEGGEISGVVTLDGQPLSGVTVEASYDPFSADDDVTTTTDADGAYELVLPMVTGWFLSVEGEQPWVDDALCWDEFEGQEQLCTVVTDIDATSESYCE